MERALKFYVFYLTLCITALAQERAITESGQRVILHSNRTWQPESEANPKGSDQFKRSPTSTEKISLIRGKFSVYFNPKIWQKSGEETPTRQSLQHKDGDAYVLIIAERMEVPLETLKNIALSNAKKAAPDSKITFEDRRKVNGVEVLVMQIKGTVQGVSFVYYGYYYAGKEGCIQVLTYTSQNLFNEYKTDFVDFLNGFSIEP